MSSGQNVLVIGALSILTLLIISFYNTESNNYTMTFDNEAIVTATGLGQIIIEQISSKHFDEKIINNYLEVPDSLTGPLDLGAEDDETELEFYDDVDDFNNFSRIDSLGRLGKFNISVVVKYIQKEMPDSVVNERTFYKLATVSVSNSYLMSTLKLHYLASY